MTHKDVNSIDMRIFDLKKNRIRLSQPGRWRRVACQLFVSFCFVRAAPTLFIFYIGENRVFIRLLDAEVFFLRVVLLTECSGYIIKK